MDASEFLRSIFTHPGLEMFLRRKYPSIYAEIPRISSFRKLSEAAAARLFDGTSIEKGLHDVLRTEVPGQHAAIDAFFGARASQGSAAPVGEQFQTVQFALPVSDYAQLMRLTDLMKMETDGDTLRALVRIMAAAADMLEIDEEKIVLGVWQDEHRRRIRYRRTKNNVIQFGGPDGTK
jgi:hypothetical protein